MTDDDAPDDPQLKSLRAVWLALPDEEPPMRGLDALMAAARVKAEALAAPPWWKRLLHGMSRPPVLALATITVLIGGAVLISNRKSADEAMPTVKRNTAPAEGAGAPPAVATPPTRELHRDQAGEQDLKQPPVEATKAPVEHTPPVHHAPARAPEPKPKPDPVTKSAGRPIGGVASPAFEAGAGGKVDATTVQSADELKEEPAKASAATRAPGRVMTDQLLVQCRSAAARGDCETARQIARRIASQDATYYREHVASDAAILKCISAQ